jgi:hypothetical protein
MLTTDEPDSSTASAKAQVARVQLEEMVPAARQVVPHQSKMRTRTRTKKRRRKKKKLKEKLRCDVSNGSRSRPRLYIQRL